MHDIRHSSTIEQFKSAIYAHMKEVSGALSRWLP
jgi:hypothetical protein